MNHRLRLMHVFPNFSPGGAELRVTRIINGMSPGVKHAILPLHGDAGAGRYIAAGMAADFLAPPAGAGRPLYFRALRKAIRAAQPDVLLTYNWGAIEAVVAAVAGRLCPVIHNECGFGEDEAARLKTRRVLARRILLRRVYAVTVTSRTMLEIALRRFKLPAAKVRWIRTGVDTERFRPGLSRGWRERMGVQPEEVLFGYLGAIRPEKDLPLLLRAFQAAAIPGARLAVVGEGACRGDLEHLARELGIAGAVIFPGHESDPAPCFAAMDVFVLSSATEQTSNSLLEAMASGLPAVTTDVGDCREVLGEAGGPGIVPRGDLRAYAHALALMAGSAELRAQLGAANRRRALEEYPEERMIRQYEALYEAARRSARR